MKNDLNLVNAYKSQNKIIDIKVRISFLKSYVVNHVSSTIFIIHTRLLCHIYNYRKVKTLVRINKIFTSNKLYRNNYILLIYQFNTFTRELRSLLNQVFTLILSSMEKFIVL